MLVGGSQNQPELSGPIMEHGKGFVIDSAQLGDGHRVVNVLFSLMTGSRSNRQKVISR